MIVEENDELVRKLYRSGLFCFAFMYQGSNVLPLSKPHMTSSSFKDLKRTSHVGQRHCEEKHPTQFPGSLVLYLHHRSQHDL